MLPYFPAPFPDELLYSVIARYHRHVCSPGPKATLEDLFGNRSVRASADLQGHLGALADRLPQGIDLDAERIARRHTLLPYYTAFQPPGVAAAEMAAMVSGTTDGLHLRLGIATSTVQTITVLRFCPSCHAEAVAVRGERCWRRAHQLPGVLVCPDHGVPLLHSTVDPRTAGQHAFVAAIDENCRATEPPPWATDPIRMALLGRIAWASARLLEAPYPGRTIAETQAAVRASIAAAGLARPSGRPDGRRLEALRATVLAPLRDLLPEASSDDWLLVLIRRHRSAVHPLHHVLLGVLLEAAGPGDRRPPGPVRRRFLADEPAFAARLTALVAEGGGLRATARALGVDPRTVLLHAARLGLAVPWKMLPREPVQRDHMDGNAIRERWLCMLAEEPGIGVTALRRRLAAEYMWLYRHDRDWLRDHQPAPAPRDVPGPRVDWVAVDSRLAADITAAAAELKAVDPPVRVTLATLERAVNKPRWISSRKRRLPRTMAAIEAVSESVEAFRMRRLAWAEATLGAEDRDIARWRIQRLAGLPHRWRPEERHDA